jgi:hypothetical protein
LRTNIGKRRAIALIALVAIVSGAFFLAFDNDSISDYSDGAFSGGGAGTAADPFVILTADDLKQLKDYLGTSNANKVFVLGADIDLSGAPWAPIGGTTGAFAGTLDGAGHKITGMYITNIWPAYVGLFGAANGATIKNLTLETTGINLTYTATHREAARAFVGTLVGYGYGTNIKVEDVHVVLKGNVVLNSQWASADSVNNNGYYFGGMFGLLEAPSAALAVSNSSVTGPGKVSLVASGKNAGLGAHIGGFAGVLYATAKYCWSEVDVEGNSGDQTWIGGFAGSQIDNNLVPPSVQYCYSTGNVKATAAYSAGTFLYAGGFMGGYSAAKYCYAEGNVTVTLGNVNAGTVRVGGFIGYTSWSGPAYTSDNYARGNVAVSGTSSTSVYVGGFLGYADYSTRSYSTGTVTGPGNNVGGFIGRILTPNACFWDVYTSGRTLGAPGSYDESNIIRASTAAMKTASVFTSRGWDFTDVWGIDPKGVVNDGYPILKGFSTLITAVADPAEYPQADNTFEYMLDGDGTWIEGNEVIVPIGSEVEFRVKTVDGGYVHSYWSQSDEPLARYYSAGINALTQPGSNTLTAHFLEKDSAALLTVVSYPSDAGAFTFGVGGQAAQYDYLGPAYLPKGSVVNITATAEGGYAFVMWSGGYGANPVSGSMILDGDKNITALFKLANDSLNRSLTLTADPTGGGTFAFMIETSPNFYSDGFVYTGTVLMPAAATVKIVATPAGSRNFSYWSGDLVSYENPAGPLTLSENRSVTGHFTGEDGGSLLTVNENGGSVTVTIGGNTAEYVAPFHVATGTTVSLYAAAPGGSEFSYWSGDVQSSQNPVTFTMTGSRSVAANYTSLATGKTLTVNENNGSVTVTVNGTTTFDYVAPVRLNFGAGVMLTATAPNNKTFSYWSGDEPSSVNPLAFEMDDNKNVAANYADSATGKLLTVNANGGSVTVKIGTTTFDYVAPVRLDLGVGVTLTATAPADHTFSYWSGSEPSSLNPVTFSMNDHKSVVANYTDSATGKLLTVNANGGSATVKIGTTTFDYAAPVLLDAGVQVTLAAAAPGGKTFSYWSGDVQSSLNPVVFVMDDNKSVEANYAGSATGKTLTVNANGGSVTVAIGATTFAYVAPVFLEFNTSVSLTAAPPTDMTFSYWSGDVHSSRNPVTFLMNDNKSVAANYAGNQTGKMLTVNDNGGSVEVTVGSTTFAYVAQVFLELNTSVSLTAAPPNNSRFSYWSGDVEDSRNPVPFVMDNHKSVTANYAGTATGKTLTVNANGGSVTVAIGATTFDYVAPVFVELNTAVSLHAAPPGAMTFS